RTVPRGWSMETTGVLSGRRPSSRPPAAAAGETRPADSARATARTAISLAMLMSDLPSLWSTVERPPYFANTSDRARNMTTSDSTDTVEASTADAHMPSGTRSTTTPTAVTHLARLAAVTANQATRVMGPMVVVRSRAMTTRPTRAAPRPVTTPHP